MKSMDHYSSFNKYLVSTRLLGMILGAWGTSINKTNKNPCFCGAYILVAGGRL